MEQIVLLTLIVSILFGAYYGIKYTTTLEDEDD